MITSRRCSPASGWLHWGALFSLLLSTAMWGQAPQPPNPLAPKTNKKNVEEAPLPTSPQTHELTASDVDAFLAGVLPLQLERENIAGAVVLVVKDGKVLYSHGYGYADVEKKTPVSPDSTLFRPGSISKLLNWTAVMQLVEQGKLDLDRDVNDYLDFKIPATYSQPVTLRNIMTHTGGFEETVQELFVRDASDLKPLDAYLKTHMPARIFPPATTPAYSNYATSVA